MNAPTFAKYAAPAPRITAFVPGYDHDGILFNVTVDRDEDECCVTRITAADSLIDLFDLFPPTTLQRIGEAIDDRLSGDACKHNAAAGADRADHDRAMA